MRLSDEQKRHLHAARRRHHPREACGIITRDIVIELENHNAGTGAFRIRGEDLEAASKEYGFRHIDAVWHSHPSNDRRPSEADILHHPWPAAMVIVTIEEVDIYESEADARNA